MNDFYKNIIDKLKKTNRKINLISSLEGLVNSLFYFALIVFGIVILEALFNFSGEVRTILFFASIAVIVVIISKEVFLPLIRNIDSLSNFNLNKIAKLVGKNYPEVKDSLLNAVQLVNDKSNNYSKELIQAAFKTVYDKTQKLNFTEAVKFNKWNKVKISAGTFIPITLLVLLVPFLNNAFNRMINYDKEFIVPPKYHLAIEPGNIDVTKGESVAIIVTAKADIPKSITLFTRSTEQAAFDELILLPDSNNNFTQVLKSLNSSIEYYAEAEDVSTDVYSISVMDRPIVRKFVMTITPPSYTRLPQQVQNDNGSATVLPGTRLDFEITSTKPLTNAKINIIEKDNIELDVNSFVAKGHFYVRDEISYNFDLVDTSNVESENPIRYSVNITEDEFPQIEITKPGENVELGLENILPLTIEIKDDYGFSSLELLYHKSALSQTNTSDFTTVPISISKSEKQQEVFFGWDIAQLNLKAEEIVSYYVEVADNDNINGPKKSRSKVFTLRIPSLDELFANADQKQNEASDDLNKTLEEAKKLSDELQQISDELKKDDKRISWEEKEKIEKAMQKFESLEQKVDDIKKQLDDVRKDLADNNLLSEETLQKYMELQDLMDQFSSEEMKKAFEKMREQLENMMRNQVQNEMENLQFNEEMFKKSLERTVNLLKRIQIEQKMDELLKRTEQISEELSDLNEQTEQSSLQNQQERNELAEKQKSLTEKMENLEKETEALSEKMSEFDDMPQKDAQELSEQMKQQQNTEMNEQTSQQLQKGQKQDAMQMQQQMMKNMQANMEKMQAMQNNMKMQTQMKVMSDMMKSLDDLLTLSKEEEDLKNKTRDQSVSTKNLRESAQQQNQIQSNLDKVTRQISELSQKTFGISPEMGRALGQARREMSQSIMDMQENNGGKASQSQERAMKNMNEAAMMMKNSLEMMMSGEGQGGGMMSMMQQLQQMSQQQMSLNQMTQMMQQGQLSQQQMAQMQRLAQEQQMIQKSLAQLNEEAKSTGQSKKLGSNLEQILKEMEEVVADMQSNDVDDDLLQKQERILSKLLDAQRSINERDFEKERESFTGKNFQRETPPELMLTTEEGLKKLRDELLNASKEGYKKDYEELIRKYFEALQKEKIRD
ncbi:MAG: hypothetical protein QY331_00125 [Melioribacteraceae bacterium]|nr:MAG: hypothetical protein QY331_00125 [Melioribacteraceae bacterium]